MGRACVLASLLLAGISATSFFLGFKELNSSEPFVLDLANVTSAAWGIHWDSIITGN